MKKRLLCVAALLIVMSVKAQVGIGTKTPNKSAELTIVSKNKGLLIPSISLSGTTDTTTISNGNVESLLVYANLKQGDIEPGFYYWNKNKWVRLVSDVDVSNIVINNFEEIIKNENVQNVLNTLGGNVFYDGTRFEYLDRSGSKIELLFQAIVKANETITTLAANANGTYTYKSENDTEVTIDIPAVVVQNFETIVNTNSEFVKNIIEQIAKDVEGNVTYNGTDLVYKDASGTEQIVDLSQLIKANETVTTLIANANGTYTYKSENDTEVTIDIPAAVAEHFETIVNTNSEFVKNIIEQIAKDIEGNVTYNGTDLVYKDASGADQIINLAQLVKANETVTTLVANANGTYTYKSEDDTEVTIDIPAAVAENFQTIVNTNSETVKNIIEQIAKDIEGNVTYNGTNLVYKDASGTEQIVDLSQLVKANETITTLVANANGTYTYKSENDTEVTIDIPASVAENFQTIVNSNSETVKNIIEQIAKDIEGNVTYNGTDLVYKDASGADQIINLAQLIKANETVTTLIANANGTYTYKSENDTEVTIDIPAAVAENFETIVNTNSEFVKNIIEQIAKDIEGNVTYNGTNLVYKDASGTEQIVDLSQLVKANETITTLVANANGTYTYKSENDTEVTIDIPASVAENFQTIVNSNSETVKNIIEQIAKDVEGNVTYNGTNLVYKDATGTEQIVDLSQLVKANETITTLVANANGTYTYKSENDTEVTIDIPAAVAEHFETIVNTNSEFVKNIIEQIAKDVEGNVTYNGTDLVYKDASGADQIINLAQLVKANETVTTLIANANGTYTYKSENDTEVTIDIPAAVAENFETIVNTNSEFIKNIIEQIAKDVEGNVTYNGTNLVYKDASGTEQIVDLSQLVKANETITTLVANANGTYTYKSENDTEVTIDIPAAVAENFETIVNTNSEFVKNIIEQIAKDIEGNVTYNGTNLVYKDATGTEQIVDLSQLVKANETVTTLIANANGTYTYKSENDTEVTIDIPAAVAENFETIVNTNSEFIKNIIEQIAKDVEGNVTYNGTNLVYKDASGTEQIVDLSQLVKANETITTLVANANGTYTYKSENDTEVTIDIPAAVAENFETIVNTNSEFVKNIIEQIAKDIEGNVTYNGTNLVYKDATGTEQIVDLSQLVKANETVTTLIANANGTYTYKSENDTEVTIDIPASVAENFETIVNTNSEFVKNIIEQIAKDIEGNVTYNGTNLVYKDATGTEQIVDLSQLVKANETVTTLIANANGTYTYKSENDTEVTIDIPASVAEHFQTIVNTNSETVKNIIEQIAKDIEGNVTYNGTDLVYKDASGTDQIINLAQLIKANETVTTLVANANGTYTYKSENDTEVTIDIPAAVAEHFETIVNTNSEFVKNIIEQIAKDVEGNVTYNGTDLVYKDASGADQIINLAQLIKANETVTTLIANANGTYTYKSENDTEVTIDIPAAVAEHFETIVNTNSEFVKNIIEQIAKDVEGNVTYNGTDLVYKDATGTEQIVDLSQLVKANETITTLVANANGTYTYKSENDTEVTIDIPASVAENFQTIVNTNSEFVKNIIEQIAKDVEGNVTYNGTNLVYKDASGTEQIVDLSQLVKANETITTLVANANGTYTYKSENDTEVTIDIPAAVAEHFETIVNTNSEFVKNIIEQIAKDIEGNVTYNGTNLVYKDASGTEQIVDLSQLVKANETITTLVANANGTYTYKSENDTEVTIDIPAAVAEHFETIVNTNSEFVKNIIEQIAKDVEGNVTYNGTDLVYKDASGTDQIINLAQLIKANETITTLVANANGTYTYKSENDTEVTIDIPASVAEHFETIVNTNSEFVKNIIEQIAKDVEGNVTYNGTDLVYKDASGADQIINLAQLIKANETITTLVANANGTYTYKSENDTEVTIDIPAAVAENFETIVNTNSEFVKNIIEQIAKDVEGNVTYNGTDLVYKDASGTEQIVDLSQLVKANETITTLVANANGTYTYKSENDTEVTIDIPAAVAENFETIVNTNSEFVKNIIEQIAKDVEGNVTYNGTDLVYKDASGADQIINLAQLIKANETITTLVANANGTYTYKSENDTEVTIDIPAAVAENFETIVNTNSEFVKNIIEQIAKDVEGNVTYNGTDLVYKDASGADQIINLAQLVKANETITTLVANANGTYTYKSENDTEVTIDIPASVAENFQTIVNTNSETVKNIIEQIAKDVEGNVTYNGTNLVYKDATGTEQIVDLSQLVKANETITTLVANANGTYTYKSENDTEVTIDIPAAVAEHFETIVNTNSEFVKNIIEQIAKDVEGNVTYNGTNLVYKDATGTEQIVDLSQLVKANETITTLVANANGTYTYKSENNTEVTIDIPAAVAENFETIVTNNPETVKKTIEEVAKNAEGNIIFDGTDFIYRDANGDLQKVSGDVFKQNISGILYDIIYLQGTSIVKIPVGSTRNIPGLETTITVPKGQKKVLLFTISGSVRADVSGGAAGQGIFALYDESNTKLTSMYANFTDINGDNIKLLNAPMVGSMQKQVVIDNSTGTQDLVKTYLVKYTAWATRPTNSDHVVNFIPTSFAGYQNDTESLLSKLSILIFNM
ncbi:hypothetical protein [Myroides odoratus]|uniref:hypothetical protein n=1 Tax=Myroides odoratus TaxID=256 RepID=UPI0039B08697